LKRCLRVWLTIILNAKTRSKKLSGLWQKERLPLSLAPQALSAQSRPSPCVQNPSAQSPYAQNCAHVPGNQHPTSASPSRRANSTPSTPATGGAVPSKTPTATAARTSAGCTSTIFKASLEEVRTPQPISSRSAPATTNSFINSAISFGRRPITIIESSCSPSQGVGT